MAGDNPIHSRTADRLHRKEGAASLAHDIREADASEGFVVGIVGPWGSGKTSIVNLVREYLHEDPVLVTIDFNPWIFSGTDDLINAFFRELSAELKLKGDQLAEIAETVDTYGDLLTPATLLPFVGNWISRFRSASKVYAELHEKRKGSVNQQRDKVAERLAGLDSPIVVIIDDIDRLESSEIRDIFKLVRLTASFPNIIYVLAFDRARVEEALNQSGFDGRAYLEKIVQLGVDVPAIPEPTMLRQIGEALERALNDLPVSARFNDDAWPDILMEIVRPLLKNIRDVKRYAAAVRSKARTLNGQVELVDILGLEAVRLFLPDVFAAMVAGREGLTTVTDTFGSRYEDPSLKEQVQHIVEVGQSHPKILESVVTRMFPAASRHVGNTQYGESWLKNWLKGRRVAHPDVFAAYLEHVANDSMMAFGTAEAAFAVLSDASALGALLRSYEIDKLEDVIAALESFEDEYPVEAAAPATKVLLNLLPDLPEREHGMMTFVDTRLVVARVVLRLLRRLDSPQAVTDVVAEVLPSITSLSSKYELVTLIGHREGAGHKLVSEEDAKSFEQGLAAELSAASGSTLAKEQELLRLMYAPKHWDGQPAIKVDPSDRELVRALLLAARSVVRTQSMGSRKVRRTTRLHWDVLVEALDGEENLKEAIKPLRKTKDDEVKEVVELVDKYLGGWRPDRFEDD